MPLKHRLFHAFISWNRSVLSSFYFTNNNTVLISFDLCCHFATSSTQKSVRNTEWTTTRVLVKNSCLVLKHFAVRCTIAMFDHSTWSPNSAWYWRSRGSHLGKLTGFTRPSSQVSFIIFSQCYRMTAFFSLRTTVCLQVSFPISCSDLWFGDKSDQRSLQCRLLYRSRRQEAFHRGFYQWI